MGVDSAAAMFLCAAKSLGVDFTRTATIGRQTFFPEPATLRRVFSFLRITQDAEDFLRENPYSEPFFALLGAKVITSLDYSSYENATIIHDMNSPIPENLHEQFSIVHDGGTIEHVFNVPQAFKNCMQMVQIGGHFTQVTVANNYMGHGFWQFSPELLFGAFSPANGYQIEVVLLHEAIPGGSWYMVTNPDEVRSRVELCNHHPTYILTVAKRVARADIFASPPLQSDYVAAWNGTAKNQPQPDSKPGSGNTRSRAVNGSNGRLRFVPVPVKRAVKIVLNRLFHLLDQATGSGFNKRYYKRVKEDNLLRGQLR